MTSLDAIRERELALYRIVQRGQDRDEPWNLLCDYRQIVFDLYSIVEAQAAAIDRCQIACSSALPSQSKASR